jgi:ABC-2 type transport system ATP-binding protein
MNSEKVVTFDRLSKFYGKHIGVQDLSFEVRKGEIFGFLGPNGAGKTTTIRLMLDLLKPSSGSVTIFGMEVSRHSLEIRKRLGYLPGNFTPYDKMTGDEFLAFSMKIRQKNPVISQSYFDLFELSKRDRSKKIREYSQGMKQKIGIIHAVAHEPELVILDEPSTGLDPLMQDALYELLIELHQKEVTLFFSSHNLPEVEKICEKVSIVKEGRLVGWESLAALRQHKRKKMRLLFRQRPEKAPVLENAVLVSEHPNGFDYHMTGEIRALLIEVAGLPISDVLFPEPSLEDIFLGYYEKYKLPEHEK